MNPDNDNKTVLVFPAGTEAAYEIHDALKYAPGIELIGASSGHCHADFVFAKTEYCLPSLDDPGFLDSLNRIIENDNADFVFPADRSALRFLCDRRSDLKCTLIAPDSATVTACEEYIRSGVSGPEISVDCFTDSEGKLKYICPRTRERIRADMSVRSENIDADDALVSLAEELNSRMSFDGAWFFHAFTGSGGYVVSDICPGISGSMGFSRALGINFPLLTLGNYCGLDIDTVENRFDVLLDRAFLSRYDNGIEYENVYVDFDDTLVLNGKVNPVLMQFLYQCRNRGKKIYLLTRHSTDIYDDLRKYCISESLFDDIVHLTDSSDNKTDYIKPDSVFIDDSFAERKRVRELCNIPVFDLDMIESLLDWR